MISAEGGKAFALTERWTIEPQRQLAWQHNDFDDVLLGGDTALSRAQLCLPCS